MMSVVARSADVGKQAHWNLVGRQFHDVHLHLDELVGTARTYSDKVAERSVSVGVPADGRAATVSTDSGVPAFEAGWVEARDVIRQVFESVDATVRGIRPRIEELDKADLVTQDLSSRSRRRSRSSAGCGRRRTSATATHRPADRP